MTRATLCTLAASAALAAALGGAPAARANAFQEIFADYKADNLISACAHSEEALRDARGQIPNDIEQYAPDFPAALDAALEARARGACDKPAPKPAAAPAPAPAPPPAPPARKPAPARTVVAPPPEPPATSRPLVAPVDTGAIPAAAARTGGGAAGAPAPVLLLAALGGLLALAAAAAGLVRWRGWDPAWLASARHAWSEAGWRAGATWAEFADWVRLGR